ncbi:site-specific integrase [Nocardiopsis sp. CNT312]|uniref:tyrosine-type recombinase/integrase n=1 Tax=Nocardiopsis sp. CNT312 TaxID=1137268 RepID=UPI0004B66851|nr:site-specific integrase [Nocardiopsis sp. CNT312]
MVYGQTKEEVREALRELREEHETGIRPSPGYTVADAVNDWLKRGLKGRSAATVTKYRSLAANNVIPHLGKAKLRELTADDVDDWLDERAEHLATSTLKQCLDLLRRAIRHAQRRNRVLRNVAELVDPPEGRAGRPSKALNLEQAKAVLAVARSRRLYAYVMVSLLTGVRTEEARELTWPHVHLDPPEGTPPHVAVWRSVRKDGDTKTKKSRRTLALPAPVVAALKAHRETQETERKEAGKDWPDTDLVFRTRTGAALDVNNVRRDFQAIVRAAKVEGSWTPRELRHSFVSLMSANGAHLEDIARLVGHSSTNTTELVYRKELHPVIMEGADIMGDLFAE